jgi:hypothetical protein
LKKKKEILRALGYNPSLKDGKLDITTKKPLLVIERGANLARAISDRLEPPKSVEEQRQIKQEYAKSNEMWRCAESNRGAIGVRSADSTTVVSFEV